jgi:hypothetical protein
MKMKRQTHRVFPYPRPAAGIPIRHREEVAVAQGREVTKLREIVLDNGVGELALVAICRQKAIVKVRQRLHDA